MAYKRIFLCTVLLAICYLVGVTWAETAAIPKSSPSPLNNNTRNASDDAQKLANTVAGTATLGAGVLKVATNKTAPKCVCDGALLPRLSENGKVVEICKECKCQNVAHNTTLIKVVVIIVIWIISILVIYMLFLMCLDPLLNKRVKANYQEHTNEDDDATSTSPPLPSNNQEMNARANVLGRVGHQTDKWKRQVREQRRHIYDRRTMLN